MKENGILDILLTIMLITGIIIGWIIRGIFKEITKVKNKKGVLLQKLGGS